MFWNNSKKTEKQREVKRILEKIQQGEMAYSVEIYLRQQQLNLIKAQYTKVFAHLNVLKQWFRSRVTTTLDNELRHGLIEKFQDLE